MDSKKLEQVVDMVDGLKSQAVAVGDFLKHFQNDQECKNNEKSSVSPTLYVKRQFPDTENTACHLSREDTSWKRKCLAHAIQWHSPRLMTPPFSCACITQLGEILHSSNRHDTCARYHCLYTQQKTVKLLIDIKNADLDKMERCLNVIQLDNPSAVKTVWDLFKQYQEMGPNSLRCGFCKVRCIIDIKCLSVNLWRNGIISDHLFEDISTSAQNNESTESLWKDLENELKKYTTRDHIIAAIADTLDSCCHMDEDVMAEMKRLTENANFELSCECPKHYFDVPRRANKSLATSYLETDASFSENERNFHTKAGDINQRRTKSRSTSASRRKSFPQQECKCQSSGSKSLTKQNSNTRQIERLPSWPPDKATGKTITVDKKKSKVINIHNSGKGPVNVGNSFLKVGKQHLSDTSNETESLKSTPNDSDSDTGRSVVSTVNEEIHETINVTRNPMERLCKFRQDYRPEFMVKTSRRRRTVSESAIQKESSVENPDIIQPSLGTEQ